MTATQRIWLGRDREMAILSKAIADLRAGRGGLVLISGEPGVGKTRLADEVCRLAPDLTAHWGRAWEAGGAPVYWLFAQVLRAICGALDATALAAIAGRHGSLLAGLVPELRERLPGLSLAPTQTHEQFELFCAVDAFLHAATARTPRLLVLDDLHASDPSSLLMLELVVRNLRSRALLIIGTYRDIEARRSAEIGETLDRLARDADAVMPLRRLDRDQVVAFITLATGGIPSPERVDAMYRHSEGNPFFLRELLQLQDGAVLPPGIRAVVRARLGSVTPAVRATLEAGAILGREPSIPILSGMMAHSEPETREQLEQAARAGIVEPFDGGWRFTHVLLRDGLEQELSASRLAELHHAAALELRRQRGDLAVAEIAHHMIHAPPIASVEDMAEAVHAAARRAMELLAFEDARVLYAHTCKALDIAAPSYPVSFDALLGLGLAEIRTANIDLGKRTCLRAADLAREAGDPERFASAVLASTYELVPGMRDAVVIGLLEEALAMLPPNDSALRARCMAQLAAERQAEPDLRPVVELARDAIAMARRAGDDASLCQTLSSAALAFIHHVEPSERMVLNLEILRRAQMAGDKRIAVRAHLFLINDFWELGDPTGAAAHVHAFATLARESLHDRFRWVLTIFDGAAARSDGRFEEATRAIDDVDRAIVDDEARGASLAAARVLLCATSERYDHLAELEARTRRDFGALRHELASCLGEILIAFLYARAGDRRRATTQLAVVRSHPAFPSIREATWLGLLAAPVHLVGDAELAARLYRVLAPRAHLFFNLGPLGYGADPPYSQQLGLLAETLGRHDDAVAAHEAAEAGVIEAGMRGHLARARYYLARALEARDKPGDRERAAERLAQASALATELDQRALVTLLSTRVHRVSSPPDPITGGGVLAVQREGDHWRVDWQDRTVHVRDSRGIQVLAQLVASPDQELHVLQLASSSNEAADTGDSGALLDPTAVHQYRNRLLDLREQLAEAEELGDPARAARLGDEIEFLTRELARAVGLGGRGRSAGSGVERARTAVQKRLRSAIQRIEDADAAIGRHLHHTIRTGTFCVYQPGGVRHGRR